MTKKAIQYQFWRLFLPVFLIFSVCILAFQYNREKQYKTDTLDAKLDDSNTMIFNHLEKVNGSLEGLDSIVSNFPSPGLRMTIINLNGKVVYDNVIKDVSKMENHLNRKEIIQAQKSGFGSDIRKSHTNNQEYYYYANRFGNCFVRSSLPYDMQVSSILSPNNLYLYFLLILTLGVITVLLYFFNKMTIQFQREQIEHDASIRRKLTQQIAHELKTPLSSIIGYMETLNDVPDISAERQRFFIERSHAQAVRLNELLQDILVLNQLNEAPKTVEMEPVCLNNIINQVLEDVELNLSKKNIIVETSFGGDIWLKANQMLIYSIFRNLMDNTIAYAGENINVRIALTGEDATSYHFIFSDTGTGISEEHLPFIFDRFYRVDKGRSRKTGGTGLGLSIVKNAIEFHKGTISAYNRNGGGLEFRFSLHK